MLEVLQVAAPFYYLFSVAIVFFGVLKLAAKIFKFRNIDESIKF